MPRARSEHRIVRALERAPLIGATLRVVVATDLCRLTLCGGAWDPQNSYFNLLHALGRCCLLRSLLSFNGRSTGVGAASSVRTPAESIPEIRTGSQIRWNVSQFGQRSPASSSRYSRMLTLSRHVVCPTDQPARVRSSSSIVGSIAITWGG